MGRRRRPLEGLVTMATPNPGFWRGRRVLLTGHSGFKGAWLGLWLAEMGAEVHGFSLPPERAEDAFFSAGINGLVQGRFGDLRDIEALTQAYRDAEPEIVLHLAAQPLVRRSYDRPLETVATNAMGTVNLLDLCHREHKPRAVVVITTDKVYRNLEAGLPFREDDPLGGHDPYSAGKAAAEILCESWRKSFLDPAGIPMATARAGNVIGGGDFSTDRLVPDAIRSFVKRTPLTLRMPQAVRPWQHVVEPLAGYLLLAEGLASARTDLSVGINFGPDPGQFRAVGQVAETMARLWGDGASVQHGGADNAKPEAGHLTLSSERAAELLDWRPQLDMEAALALTVQWYRRWADGAAPSELAGLMRRQIAGLTGGQ